MNRIVFITGGARSGKSSFAESLALQIKSNSQDHGQIAYLATGEGFDYEFTERIRHHQKNRSKDFKTYEESLNISDAVRAVHSRHNIFILECLTTWLGNLFVKMEESQIEDYIYKTLDALNEIFQNSRQNKNPRDLFASRFSAADGNQWKYSSERLLNPEAQDKTLIVISNELGLGIVPADQISRHYRDIHGRMNQRMACYSDYAYFVASGIPVRLI